MAKRTLTLCLAVFMLFTSVVGFTDVKAAGSISAQYSVANGSAVSSNVTVKTTSASSVVTIGGEYALKVNNDKQSRVLFDVDASLGNSADDGSSYTIEINYYDSSADTPTNDLRFFSLWVDKLNYGMQRIQHVPLLGDNKWKTVTIEVEDARFDADSTKDTEADIMIRLYDRKGNGDTASGRPLYLKSLNIIKNIAQNPVLVESYIEELGNTFEYAQKEKQVINTFTNTKNEDLNLKAEYFMLDGFGDVKFSFTDEFVLPAKEEIKKTVTINSQECGVFQWIVNVTDETGTINSRFFEDTLAIVKTAEDKLENSAAWIVCHLERYRNTENKAELTEEQRTCLELINKANIKGARLETTWYLVEYNTADTKRNLNFEGTYYYDMANHYDKYDIDYWVLLTGCAFGYRDDELYANYKPMRMPKEAAEVDAWERFCKYIIEIYAKRGVELFEIWNEPNVAAFNPENATPAQLAEITKRARKAANELEKEGKINPVKIAGLSVTGLNESATYNNWLNPAIAAGIVGGNTGMDVLNIHTYTHDKIPERAKIYNYVKKFRDRIKAATGSSSDIPVLISEYGNALGTKTSEEQQRDWNIRSAILYRMLGFGDQVAIYNLEQKGDITDSGDDHYGLISPVVKELNIEGKVGIPTESYVAYAAMNYVLRGDVTPVAMLDSGENVRINHLKRNTLGDNVLAMWTAFNDAEVTLNLGVNSVKYYDTFGNERTMTSPNGQYTIPLNSSVSYITGNFTSPQIVDADEQVVYEDFEGFKGNAWALPGWIKTSIEGTVNTGTQLTDFYCNDGHGTSIYLASKKQTDANGNAVYGNHALYREVGYVVGDTPVNFHTNIRIKNDGLYATGNEYRAGVVNAADIEDTIFGFKLVGEETGIFTKSNVLRVYCWDKDSGGFRKSNKTINMGSWASLDVRFDPTTEISTYYVNGEAVATNCYTPLPTGSQVLGNALLAAKTIHTTSSATHLCGAIFDDVSFAPYDSNQPILFTDKEYVTNNGTITFTTTAVNQLEVLDTVTILTAFYDERGRLVNISQKPINLTGKRFESITTGAITAPSDGVQAKFFIWDMESLRPLSSMYKVRYN